MYLKFITCLINYNNKNKSNFEKPVYYNIQYLPTYYYFKCLYKKKKTKCY